MSDKNTPEKKSLSMGAHTLPVPVDLFALNRRRLVEALKEKALDSIVLLQGGDEVPFYDTDITYNTFRQESYFMWAFGVTDAGCYGALDVKTGDSYLFIPRLPEEYAVWMGPLLQKNDFSSKYGIPHVYYVDELKGVLERLGRKILTLKGLNSDSGLTAKPATFEGIDKFTVDDTILFPIIANLRVYKTEHEIRVIRYVVAVSSYAHRQVMKFVKPGKYEFEGEAKFLAECYEKGGCRHVSYTCICGSGVNGAILHYGHAGAPNNTCIKDGDICLFDMGANYFGYAADITCTFPANGKFTQNQKLIYEAVLKSNRAVHKAAKPGVSWVDMHILANKTLLEELKNGGLLQGDVNEMVEAGLAAIFQPHGLGHLMGLDVHDVGAYLKGQPERPEKPGLNKLRTARVLEKDMVLTIEPGCYFIDPLLDKALNDPSLKKFLVPEVIKRFRNFGGVRIEDNVLITADGVEDLTIVPRSVEDIENWIEGKVEEQKYFDSQQLFIWWHTDSSRLHM
ncbi:xaa-Pro dipeptidase [Euwallacea similis]|uniref:xaa-Pro dipeptidase n=1 Tax=Euwallacea similis TaxID=1736056 RepID=UPI00344FE091